MIQYILKYLCRETFYIKKAFHKQCNNDGSRSNEMLKGKYNKSVRAIYGKEGFRFYTLYDLKNWQKFEMEICLLRKDREGGNISSQILLRN